VIALALALAGFGLVMAAAARRHAEDERALRREALGTELGLPGPETAGVLSGLRAPAGLRSTPCAAARKVCFSGPATVAAATNLDASRVLERLAGELRIAIERRPGKPAPCHARRRTLRRPYEGFLSCFAVGVIGGDEVLLSLTSVRYRPGAKALPALPRGTFVEVTDEGSVASRRRLEAQARRLERE